MILEEIKTKLEELDPNVFYGMVDESMNNTRWDYIVFNRSVIRPSANKTGLSHVYAVNVIRENFIPEGLEIEVIKKMKEIPGMKFRENDISFNYTEKPNTNTVVEIMTIEFVKAVKV